ncbi:MAG: T9SS type A sorting domain-containing protein [Bacteroidota bacterium]|nr:T9SS type A sorting domain-containing protein [Bacteroidota bacterium]
MLSFIRFSMLSLALLIGSSAWSECPAVVDITVRPNENDQIEVWLRPGADFENVFSSISFNIRWIDGEANLGATSVELPYMTIGTAGPEHVDGIYRYQIYFGISLVNIGSANAWVAGEEVLLTTIDVINGNSVFVISEDEFITDIYTLNGAYYVSLNGEICTGDIYSFSTSGVEAGTARPEVSISPNPTSGSSAIIVQLNETADLDLQLFDPAGRMIWQRTRASRHGRHVEQLNMEHFSSGVYMLQLQIGDRLSTHRIVLAPAQR